MRERGRVDTKQPLLIDKTRHVRRLLFKISAELIPPPALSLSEDIGLIRGRLFPMILAVAG